MTARYEGKPFLRLLDSYVLDSIGALDEANSKWLTEAEPHFRATYGEIGTWREIVEKRMQFPDGMPRAIREVWTKGQDRYRAQTGEEPDPIPFAISFVDKNFPH
ncbi:hypothetical protein [Aurantiacibacter sediminis]|uniref:Uncharacterized protein n=1 Tax=Aurantiacibacter sediminis TaxID=2793064 RepID=A0ABS0N5N2_9SPHN|nr:hypothetical protein [Aurantiacibacter sediminis]MBH5323122.1 hypothetical protein [Aurantiacibacter sediminis]